MNKKHIIILLALGTVTFGGTFAMTLVVKKMRPAAASAQPANMQPDSQEGQVAGQDGGESPLYLPNSIVSGPGDRVRGFKEKELESLIFDVREKMKGYKLKDMEISEQEDRLQIARAVLQEDIDRLSSLNSQLSLTLADLKRREEQLLKSRIMINTLEKANMERLAATYDKMDSAQAGKILITMMTNNQLEDAVKILYYMSERQAGGLLGEIADTKPEFAGKLTQELKKVRESK